MPLEITPVEAPVTSTIKITSVINDAVRALLMIKYDELDQNGAFIKSGMKKIENVDNIRIMYADIEAEIKAGSTFELASKKVLYSQIANGTLV